MNERRGRRKGRKKERRKGGGNEGREGLSPLFIRLVMNFAALVYLTHLVLRTPGHYRIYLSPGWEKGDKRTTKPLDGEYALLLHKSRLHQSKILHREALCWDEPFFCPWNDFFTNYNQFCLIIQRMLPGLPSSSLFGPDGEERSFESNHD